MRAFLVRLGPAGQRPVDGFHKAVEKGGEL